MNNDQISTKSNKNKIIIITAFGALAVIIIAVLIVILVQNNQQGSGNKETTTTLDDYIPLDGVGPIGANFRHREGYSTMLDLYYSIDNDMMLDTVETIIKDGKLDQNAKYDKETKCYTYTDEGREESVSFCVTDDDGVDYIHNLKFHYTKGDINGSITEIQDSHFQHFDGKTTNDYDIKTDAIEDYLIKQ